MPIYESARVTAALALMREELDRARYIPVQNKGVRLALRVLRGHCSDAWLTAFWIAAGSEDAIGRSQNLNAALNGILREIDQQTEHAVFTMNAATRPHRNAFR